MLPLSPFLVLISFTTESRTNLQSLSWLPQCLCDLMLVSISYSNFIHYETTNKACLDSNSVPLWLQACTSSQQMHYSVLGDSGHNSHLVHPSFSFDKTTLFSLLFLHFLYHIFFFKSLKLYTLCVICLLSIVCYSSCLLCLVTIV